MNDDIIKLQEEIQKLREDVRQLSLICGRMDKHISFVDKVYDTVKTPLEFIVNTITPRAWGSHNSLPEIEYRSIDDEKKDCKLVTE